MGENSYVKLSLETIYTALRLISVDSNLRLNHSSYHRFHQHLFILTFEFFLALSLIPADLHHLYNLIFDFYKYCFHCFENILFFMDNFYLLDL